MNILNANNISWCSWSWSAKNEKSAALDPGKTYSASYEYTEDDLTETGLFMAKQMGYSSPSGLADVKVLFGIYPNPVKNKTFEISLKTVNKATLSIFNLQGQPLYSSAIEGGHATIEANLPAGVYIVSVVSEGNTQTQKLMVE
jgi:monomeric isocitrate dehydrogenase